MIVDNNTYNSMYVTSRSKTPPSFGVNRKSTSKNDPVSYDHLEVFRNTWKEKKEKNKNGMQRWVIEILNGLGGLTYEGRLRELNMYNLGKWWLRGIDDNQLQALKV